LDAVATEFLGGGREYATLRQTVIAANPELQEREAIKMAVLAGAVADTLRARGVAEPAASLTAEAGVAVFKVAFERWVGAEEDRKLADVIREALDELGHLTGRRS
jgi:hypothetical protein